MITATFPTGVSSITVNGLHQWDYGQTMQIHATDLPSMIEVHFACVGMDEALVRSCAMVGGVGAVSIPDKCLEQAAPIYAWIYEINGTVGATTKTIVLHVTPRTRPQSGEYIPVEISDKYTEAITQMNQVVDHLKEGEMVVKRAEIAENASFLATALTTGSIAVKTAQHATNATKAIIANEVQTNGVTAFQAPSAQTENTLTSPGYYYIGVLYTGTLFGTFLYWDGTSTYQSILGYDVSKTIRLMILQGKITVYSRDATSGGDTQITSSSTVSIAKLWG